MSSSRRSGSVSWNSLRHSGLVRETCWPAAPVCQTLRSQTQSKPIAADVDPGRHQGCRRASRFVPSVRDNSRQPDAGVDLVERRIARGHVALSGRPPRHGSLSNEAALLAALEHLSCVQHPRTAGSASRDDPGPAGLVARAEAGAVVAVEVFVEQDVVAPVRIVLELLGAAVHRPPAVLVAQEDAREAVARSPWRPRTGSSCLPEPVGHSTLKSSP